jgi:hypothetical protein
VFILIISNINVVDEKKAIDYKAFQLCCCLRQAVFLKPREKLQQVQFQASTIILDYLFNKMLTAMQKQSYFANIWKHADIAKCIIVIAVLLDTKNISLYC